MNKKILKSIFYILKNKVCLFFFIIINLIYFILYYYFFIIEVLNFIMVKLKIKFI